MQNIILLPGTWTPNFPFNIWSR